MKKMKILKTSNFTAPINFLTNSKWISWRDFFTRTSNTVIVQFSMLDAISRER